LSFSPFKKEGNKKTVLPVYTTAFLMLAYLPYQLGLAGVGDVILADVSVQPVAEIKEPVVQ